MLLKVLTVLAVAGGVAIAPATAHASDVVPFTARVYATREGLVGKTTANNHKIVDRDHFVALPSGLALSSKGGGEFTVRVCSETSGRCEYAPVWDLGPWNIHDDYWSAGRTGWPDLGRGVPEAQASYQSAYNGGKDEFGRKVENPAGIDLADGMFTDGLGLTDNSWVNVTFLWTGPGGATGQIATGGGPLNVRASPTTDSAVVGLAAEYAVVPVECQFHGQSVEGVDLWDRLEGGRYISHRFVSGLKGNPPNC